jgi:hypothetical protein
MQDPGAGFAVVHVFNARMLREFSPHFAPPTPQNAEREKRLQRPDELCALFILSCSPKKLLVFFTFVTVKISL